MLSFEGCGAIPKDGKMIADDGTVLEANGKADEMLAPRACFDSVG
jgi:hypothetical protein